MLKKFLNPLPVFNVVFLALFGILTLFVGLSPTINKFGLFQPVIILFSLATVVAAACMAFMSYRPGKRTVRLYPWFMVAAFVAALAIELLIAHALTSYGYSWDSEFVYNQAVQFGQHGSLDPGFLVYLRDNPNNIGLLTILGLFFKVLHHFGVTNYLFAAVLLNVGVLFLTHIVTTVVAYMMYGRRIAVIAFGFGFVFITLSMYVQTPYTDTLTVLFPITIFFLALLFVKYGALYARILIAALIATLGVIGYLIKPTAIIAVVALMIISFIWLVATKNGPSFSKRLGLYAVYAATGLMFAGVTYLGFTKVVDATHMLPYAYADAGDLSKPITHYIAMGMRSKVVGNSVNYGGFDSELTNTIVKLQTEQAKKNFAKDAISRQLSDYGPVGYAAFLGHKIKWITSDATFYAYGEGTNKNVKFMYQDKGSTTIRKFMYVDGKYYQLFGNTLQIFWIAILLLISMQLFFVIMNRHSRSNVYTSTLRLMITGVLLFLLMFEGRSRYIFLYVPIFIILALYTLQLFKENEDFSEHIDGK